MHGKDRMRKGRRGRDTGKGERDFKEFTQVMTVTQGNLEGREEVILQIESKAVRRQNSLFDNVNLSVSSRPSMDWVRPTHTTSQSFVSLSIRGSKCRSHPLCTFTTNKQMKAGRATLASFPRWWLLVSI